MKCADVACLLMVKRGYWPYLSQSPNALVPE
jgi:hypothetical protein